MRTPNESWPISKTFFLFLFLINAQVCSGANPIISGDYTADPSARIWEDGRVWIYGSQDKGDGKYCSGEYHVYSSDDLVTWTDHGEIFNIKEVVGKVPGVTNKTRLYAPDAIYRNGIFYLYYSTSNPGMHVGVASSKSPTGPFVFQNRLTDSIDPAVFIDDDGQAYLYWAQFNMKAVKLKDNMIETEGEIHTDVVTEKEHYFHEGAWMHKRNGVYYLSYTAKMDNKASQIAYAVSNSPLGPFTWKNKIIDNRQFEGAWNNHGSILEYKDQWFVFYHIPTDGSTKKRRTAIERIVYKRDGSIPEVKPTKKGVSTERN